MYVCVSYKIQNSKSVRVRFVRRMYMCVCMYHSYLVCIGEVGQNMSGVDSN